MSKNLIDIHDNPVDGGLAKQPKDWLYSSARDYAGLRQGKGNF